MRAAETRDQVGVLKPREVGQLVKADVLKLSPLILRDVGIALEIAEVDQRSAREGPELLALVVGRTILRIGLVRLADEGLLKLREGVTKQDADEVRVFYIPKNVMHQCERFTSAGGPPV